MLNTLNFKNEDKIFNFLIKLLQAKLQTQLEAKLSLGLNCYEKYLFHIYIYIYIYIYSFGSFSAARPLGRRRRLAKNQQQVVGGRRYRW